MRLTIIGGGMAGLCAAKYAINSGHEVTIFEQTSNIGGTWIYTDDIGPDQYGLDVHTSMYHNLRTNLPKEIMEFRDYPMLTSSSSSSSRSYVHSDEFLTYLKSYAKHFDLVKLIKFQHHVVRVCPIDETKWELLVKNLPENRNEIHKFDAIFICNGHNAVPFIPEFDGLKQFQGKQMHSHHYRKADKFKDKTILTIGAGPSGVDLTYAIAEYAKKIIFSHQKHNDNQKVPSNVIKKGAIERFTENSVIFRDGSEEMITDVVFCTGFKYAMPFVSDDCGIRIEDNYICPLYKHCINIEHPTMAVIGIPFTSAVTQMIDIQVRFCLHYINGDGVLPSKQQMETECKQEFNKRAALGWPMKKSHCMAGSFHREYFNDLATTANIANIPEVFHKIYEDSRMRLHNFPTLYRNDVYKIVDDEHFERYFKLHIYLHCNENNNGIKS